MSMLLLNEDIRTSFVYMLSNSIRGGRSKFRRMGFFAKKLAQTCGALYLMPPGTAWLLVDEECPMRFHYRTRFVKPCVDPPKVPRSALLSSRFTGDTNVRFEESFL
jgi:hypothetical protein